MSSALRPPRRVLPVFAGLAGISLLAGCAGGPSDAEPESEVELTISVWSQDEAQLELFETIGEEFADQSDLVSGVRFDSIPFDSYSQSLSVRLSGGDAPDLGWVNAAQVPEYAEAGVLADVSEAFADPGYNYDDVTDSAKKAWTIDGATYGYQFSTAPDVIFYNKDAFAAAGVPTPGDLYASGDWTWETLAESAKAITDSGAAPFGFVTGSFDFATWRSLSALMQAYGAEPWSDGGESCTIDSPEMVEAMTLFQQMVYTDHSHPAPGEAADFFSGTAAMTNNKPSAVAKLEGAAFAWDVVPDPEGPAGYKPAAGKAGISVFAGAKHPEAAAEFLKYWTNEEQTARMATFFPPARTSALTVDVLAEANPLLTPEQIESVIIEAIPEIVGSPEVNAPNDALLTETAKTALEPLWQPDADVKAVLASTCDALEPLLAQ